MILKKSYSWEKLQIKLLILLTIGLFVQCNSKNNNKKTKSGNDTSVAREEQEKPISITINYHLISVKDSNEWLKNLALGDTLQAILFLNRIDKSDLLKMDSLVIPDTIFNNVDFYSPFPSEVSELSSVKKILLVSYFAQAFAVYENGNLKRWGPVSLGKESTPTPTGLFATNWKAKTTTSTIDPSWIMDWYFNLENFQGVSMHKYGLPGYPASHACVRLYEEDSKWLFQWADQWVLKDSKIAIYGTPVIIFGTYPFGGRRPWLKLAENNKSIEITSSQLIELVNQYLPTIMQRQANRDTLRTNL